MTGRPTVHLVGAGPGDPLLLTLRAARLLAEADVVVADRRSMDPLLAMAPAGAERIHVGRVDRQPAWTTEAIADLLADRANAGKKVVRLKGGDPFVCSRGAEEADALRERGVDCLVTPGVTAATAVPLAAGLRRGTSVTIASGDDDPTHPPVPWADLADPAASLVVMTGRSHQRRIAAELMTAGLPRSMPAVVVHGATRPGQRAVHTSLDQLGKTRLPPPAAFVVGPAGVRGEPPIVEDSHAHP